MLATGRFNRDRMPGHRSGQNYHQRRSGQNRYGMASSTETVLRPNALSRLDLRPPDRSRPDRLSHCENLMTPRALNGERKMVTPLFADIAGSRELIEDLDPEEAPRSWIPRAQAYDRCGPPLRRLHRAIDRRRHLRAVWCVYFDEDHPQRAARVDAGN